MIKRNKINSTIILLLISLLIVNPRILYSQSNKKAQLQKEYASLKNEIEELQKTINTRKKERNISLKEVAIINQKIEKRKHLISNIEYQLKEVSLEIIEKQKNVTDLGIQIKLLKEEYAKIIVWMNKNHNSTNKLAFVLEAKNFKDAYHRVKYLKKYGDFRAKQSIYINNNINRILNNIKSLNLVKAEKAVLLENNKVQAKELTLEKNQRDEVVTTLSKELQTLKETVNEKNRIANSINNKIKKAIEDEIKKERERLIAEIKEKKRKIRIENAKKGIAVPKEKEDEPLFTNADLENTPEGRLSSSFLNSKGGLPWPVKSGSVTSKFGKQPHPSAPELMIDNVGIDIKTTDNAEVYCIYKGKVLQIFDMPTYNTCVTVKHGNYFTVYSYLKNVKVKVGDELDAKDIIGICSHSNDHGYSLTNIQIWNFQNRENPLSWLVKK